MARSKRSYLVLLILSPALLAMIGWAGLSLWFDGPASRVLAGLLSGLFVLGSLVALTAIHPLSRALLVFGVAFAVVLVWWLSLKPSNNRDWQTEVARPPRAEIQGDLVTIHNVRNFEYRTVTDYTSRWEKRSFDLSELKGVDFFLSYWGSPLITHTIASFEFEGDRYLPISIETRKENGESYSAVRGFFRQFELYYVVGDERDLIRQRTNVRGEQVYLYRLKTPVEMVRAVLLHYLEQINRLADRPRWYNALTSNCTTTIKHHVDHVAAGNAIPELEIPRRYSRILWPDVR